MEAIPDIVAGHRGNTIALLHMFKTSHNPRAASMPTTPTLSNWISLITLGLIWGASFWELQSRWKGLRRFGWLRAVL